MVTSFMNGPIQNHEFVAHYHLHVHYFFLVSHLELFIIFFSLHPTLFMDYPNPSKILLRRLWMAPNKITNLLLIIFFTLLFFPLSLTLSFEQSIFCMFPGVWSVYGIGPTSGSGTDEMISLTFSHILYIDQGWQTMARIGKFCPKIIRHFCLPKIYWSQVFKATLEFGIDVGQGINVGPRKFDKKNKRRALNKSRAWRICQKE